MRQRAPRGRVRVGVIGFGYWGPKLARNLGEIPDAELCLIVDADEGQLARVRAQYATVRTSTDYREALCPDIDAVVIATPVRTHYRLAKEALRADKHVLVEKPLTASLAEAEELVQLAEARELTLMVGHTFVYNAAVRKLREVVESGELGQILYVDSARLNLGLFRSDVNVLWDLAPHDVSILLHVIDRDPVSVSARGSACVTPGVQDVAYVEVRFPGDLIAHFHLSWLDPCKVRRVTVVGSKKMVVYDDLSDTEKIRIYDKGVMRPYETDQFTDFHLAYHYGDVTIPHIPFEEPLRTQCVHFIECVRSGSRPETDGHAGLRVVHIVEEADKSLQNGGGRMSLASLLGPSRVARETAAGPDLAPGPTSFRQRTVSASEVVDGD